MIWLFSYLTGLLPLILLVLARKVKPIHWTNSKEANQQLAVQILIYFFGFLSLIGAHYSFEKNNQSPALLFFLFGGLFLYTFVRLCRRVPESNKIPAISETAPAILKIVAFTWFGIFVTLCGINYILVVLFPKAYGGLEGLSFIDRAFDVVYYTFSVMMTYTGNGIVAVSKFSRSVEIIEVICCFLFIGIVITNTIGKAVETPNNDCSNNRKKNKTSS